MLENTSKLAEKAPLWDATTFEACMAAVKPECRHSGGQSIHLPELRSHPEMWLLKDANRDRL